MNESISSIDFYTQFAKETNRTITKSEAYYPFVFSTRVPQTKRTIAIPYDKLQELYFLGFNDPKKFGKSSFFSGVFFKSSVPKAVEISVKKRYLIDRLNPFANQSNTKTGTDFDAKAIIHSTAETGNEWLMNPKIQEIILRLFNLDERIIIGLNQVDLDFEPSLSNCSNFGVYLNDWIFETDKIEQLFDLSLQIKTMVK